MKKNNKSSFSQETQLSIINKSLINQNESLSKQTNELKIEKEVLFEHLETIIAAFLDVNGEYQKDLSVWIDTLETMMENDPNSKYLSNLINQFKLTFKWIEYQRNICNCKLKFYDVWKKQGPTSDNLLPLKQELTRLTNDYAKYQLEMSKIILPEEKSEEIYSSSFNNNPKTMSPSEIPDDKKYKS